ncbi:MAG: DNA recombination protein RmuC [Gammaproteobacteria bacterium]|nr:DNA recombination protein RmuC [Gammaproteobacteria bacterium]
MEMLIFTSVAFLLGLVFGGLTLHLRQQKTMSQLREDNIKLNNRIELEAQLHAERNLALEKAKQQMLDSFAQLSSQALSKNNEAFLQLAEQNLKRFQEKANSDLNLKEKSIENLVKPIRDALEKTEHQVRLMEKDRKESYGALNKHLETLAEAQNKLHGETCNLVQALRRPEVRGQWGEMTLKRLAELAGMVEHCDFMEQTSVQTDNGKLRPDMIVRLPGGRDIIVDIKTPLDAYLSAVEETDEQAKLLHLQRHARHVRERVKELAAKSYWQQFKNSPDFVVLFIPGDQFLSSALDVDHKLLEDALDNRVILATPTSFVALLRAVAFGWRQESLAQNAEEIRKLGEDLHGRLTTFTEYFSKLGQSLDRSVDQYNKAIASFSSRVMPSAKRFGELGIKTKKELASTQPVEKKSRQVDVELSE